MKFLVRFEYLEEGIHIIELRSPTYGISRVFECGYAHWETIYREIVIDVEGKDENTLEAKVAKVFRGILLRESADLKGVRNLSVWIPFPLDFLRILES